MSNHTCSIDGIPFRLKAPFDFGFLSRWGRVFKVFDDQDSGNICFGTEKDGERFFVKFAGAPTARGCVSSETACENLRATVPIYRDLRHPNLIELIETAETGGGFAMVFRWADGDCMGRMYPEAHKRFMALPAQTKLKVFSDISEFLAHVAAKGYAAIDFYDGSILCDAATGQTRICDIDFFRRQPCVNDMGRMWGSSRFQSPEEYELGAVIDEITNVYTLGATAFSLFTDSDRSREAWPLSQHRYDCALRAVSDDRQNRHPSIRAFIEDWNA